MDKNNREHSIRFYWKFDYFQKNLICKKSGDDSHVPMEIEIKIKVNIQFKFKIVIESHKRNVQFKVTSLKILAAN